LFHSQGHPSSKFILAFRTAQDDKLDSSPPEADKSGGQEIAFSR